MEAPFEIESLLFRVILPPLLVKFLSTVKSVLAPIVSPATKVWLSSIFKLPPVEFKLPLVVTPDRFNSPP